MNKKRLLIAILLLCLPLISFAQFSHRFEILLEKTFTVENDRLNHKIDDLTFKENTTRTGHGIALGVKYNLKDLPLSLILGYENYDMSNHSIRSNWDITNKSNVLTLESFDFNVQYSFNKSSYKPYVFLGLSYNDLNVKRTDLSYTYLNIDEPGPIHLEEINWQYDSIEADVKTIGFNFGAGVYVRLTDNFGVSGNLKFRYIPQNNLEWLSEHMFFSTFSVGAYYRFSKRINNIQP